MFGFTRKLKKILNGVGFTQAITLALIFCIILVNIFSDYYQSPTLSSSNREVFLSNLEKMLNEDVSDFDGFWSQNWEPLEESTLSRFGFFGTEILFEKDIQEFKVLSKEWFLVFKRLSFYKLTSEGFVHKFEKNKAFTDELKDFFLEVENLIPLTKDFLTKKYIFLEFLKITNPNFKDFLVKAEVLVDLVETILPFKSDILSFLGSEKKSRVLIFNQPSSVSNSYGGKISTYTKLEIFKGKFNFKGSFSSDKIFNSDKKQVFANVFASYKGYGANEVYSSKINDAFSLPCLSESILNFDNEDFDSILFLNSDFFNFFEETFLGKEFEKVIKSESENDELYFDSSKNFIIDFLDNFEKYQENWFDFAPVFLTNLEIGNLKLILKLNSELRLKNVFGKCREDSLNLFIYNISSENEAELFLDDQKINIYKFGDEIRLKYKIKIAEESLSSEVIFVGLKLPKESFDGFLISDNLLNLNFEREYYLKQMQDNFGESEIILADEVITQKSTFKNLKSKNQEFAGYSFENSSGDLFLGGYFEKSREVEVEFSFSANKQGFLNQSYFEFYNHSNSEEIIFALGDGLEYNDEFLQNNKFGLFEITNSYLLDKGLIVRAY